MHTVYLDNAATSFPKPPTVGARMREYVDEVGASVNRGSYQAAQQAELVTLRLRQRLCALFRFADPAHVILTPGNTWGLNMLLLGALRRGDHVLVSAMEHNAVMRPLTQLAKHGVAFDRIPCDAEGRLQADRIETMLRPNTRLVLLAHASNVSGTVQDAAAVGEICAARGIPFALDAAQTAGHIPLDFTALHLSALSVPAHKGLMGPQG
ncbi:MAG TPA: aminotransferase class V-fold PLP-dependent enzyme, partial [Candidatus Agathobaculum pullistercoris]|nr:aminotransferase class V-fold PLP-dependent enzyme [Candidatus Agathobaculum pullistercoris]